MITCYDVLEVIPTASDDMIHIAYQTLSIKYDPSTYLGDKDFAEHKIQMINKAYGILSDPETRHKYDLYLQRQYAETGSCQQATEMKKSAAQKSAKMKYCTHCGKPIDESAKKCLACGHTVVIYQKQTHDNEIFKDTLKTNRSLWKHVLFSLLTFGIYAIVQFSQISCDINTIASRYDGKKTMHYCLVAFVFSGLTLGIVPIVWSHRLARRIGNELIRRKIDYRFGASTFWLWGVLGSFIFVGAFVYTHKLLKAMNLLAEDFNESGE